MTHGKEFSLTLGKVDFNGSGQRNCKAVLTWSFQDGRFSMCGEIWNPRETDCYVGGQCVDEVASYFKGNKQAQRMVALWKAWHLNDMTAGSPAQTAYLDANPVVAAYPESYFGMASKALAAAGLNPDHGYLHNGQPYKYGSAWLTRDIPDEVAAEINSWRHDDD